MTSAAKCSSSRRWLLLLWVAALGSTGARPAGGQPQPAGPIDEPPFPALLAGSELLDGQVRLEAQIVELSSADPANVYTDVEELCDFRRQRCALLVRRNSQPETTGYLSDLTTGKAFEYSAHHCRQLELDQLNVYSDAQVWRGPGQGRGPHGVIGLWLRAAESAKRFRRLSIAISGTKQLHQTANSWLLAEPDSGHLRLQMIFTKPLDNKQQLVDRLDTIRVLHSQSNSPVRIVNVLSLQRTLSDELADRLLELPVGYGCGLAGSASLARLADVELEDSSLPMSWLRESYSLEMEVLAQHHTASYSSASKFVQLIKADSRLLVHQRDQNSDIKVVYDNHFNLSYTIDLLRGSCEMANTHRRGPEACDRKQREQLVFDNGLEVELDDDLLQLLFESTIDFYLVKQVQSADGSLLLSFEATKNGLNCDERQVRIVRTIKKTGNRSSPVSVALLLLDQWATEVEQSYIFNLVRSQTIQSRLQLAQLFDLSHHCYLNGGRMLAGRDYAWLQLSYPLTGPQQRLLESNAQLVEENFRDRLPVDYFRAPRVELEFDADQLRLRVLLLNHAPVEYLYESSSGIYSDESSSSEQLAADLDRCARLCELQGCATMSYCPDHNRCILSSSRAPRAAIAPQRRCTTFVTPFADSSVALGSISLARLLASLRSWSREPLEVPEMPEELALAQTLGAELSHSEMEQKRQQYVESLDRKLNIPDNKFAALRLVLELAESLLVLLPSAEINTGDWTKMGPPGSSAEQLDEQMGPQVRLGIAGQKLSVSALASADSAANWRLIKGLSYQQCELACQDLGCSSLSYCSTSMQCVVSDIYELTGSGKLEVDGDCVIGQRDFLSKFERFEDVYRQDKYDQVLVAANPSECAHICATQGLQPGVQEGPGCLAFDFCGPNQCLLMSKRVSSSPKVAESTPSDGCDHYTRSYVADFARAAHLTLEPEEMSKLTPRRVAGLTLDRCAEMCARELLTCTAFQYCFDPMADSRDAQTCDLVEKEPPQKHFRLTQANNSLLMDSDTCHLFTLRASSARYLGRTPLFGLLPPGEDTHEGPSTQTAWVWALLAVMIGAGCSVGARRSYASSGLLRWRLQQVRDLVVARIEQR